MGTVNEELLESVPPTDREPGPEDAPPPLQFGIRALLYMMLCVGLVFGTMKWFGASENTCLIVLGLLTVSLLAAVALAAVIAKVSDSH